MTTLVLAECTGAGLDPATASAVTAARALGAPVHLLVAGAACAAAADAGARLAGVDKVLLAEAPLYAHRLAEPLAALMTALAGPYAVLLAPATACGKAVMPRVAAALDVPQISEILNVDARGTFVRPIYAGSLLETVRVTAAKTILTVRAISFAPAGAQGPAPVAPVPAAADPALSRFLGEEIPAAGGRPDLATARIVVAGGRGLASREGFALLETLADRLGAALGASRAAVDAGFAPNEWQVGQSGRTIAPDIYIAVGISGAIQHLAGIRDARLIAAVNKDPEAPIFRVADVGLVGDLFDVLPALLAALDGHKG